MNTNQIVNILAKSFSDDIDLKNIPYNEWEKIYRFWEGKNNSDFHQQIKDILPVRETVAKLIYKVLFGRMPFDREYVLKNYESSQFGIEYLFYPAQKCRRLVVLLSGYSDRKTYNRYSWYWDEFEDWNADSAYLFLNDVTNSWYSGIEGELRFEKYVGIISDRISELGLNNDQVFVIGGSMGGYGSIRLGTAMNLGGIIAINPQTSLEAVKLHNDSSWFENISRCGNQFISVSNCIENAVCCPPIYLEAGKYPADSFDIKNILSVSSEKRISLFFNLHDSDRHVTSSPSKNKIEELISIFESQVLSLETAENNAIGMIG